MAVKIGSARIDENGKARGGKAGDQTGREVSTQNWYNHSKGWRVFRPIKASVSTAIAWDMVAACDNNNIGYDQNQRNTLYNIAKDFAFNCAKVKKKCETDCSALVRVCCAYAGIMLPDFTTSNEASVLKKSGAFIELTNPIYTQSSDYLCKGDILVTKTQGHTVIVLTNGKKAKERTDDLTPDTFNSIKVVGETVNIRESPYVSSKILGIARRGEVYPYIATIDRWYEIEYKDGNAYISSKYSIPYNR